MFGVREQKLQRVLARGQREGCFGLSGAEMQVIEVARDRLVERRHLGVDQEMVVTGIGAIDTRRCDAHFLDAKEKGDL